MSKIKAAVLLVSTLLSGASVLRAQQCSQEEVSDPKAVLEEAARTCSPGLLYKAAAVLENRTVPGLRALYRAQSQVCAQIRRAARVALAKLGDASAFEAIEGEIRTEKLNEEAIRDLGLVANDQAVAALMTYMVERESDQSRIVSFGDYDYDPMFEVAATMQDIASRRLLTGRTSGEGGLAWDWKHWWNKYKGASVSIAVDQRIADPYLRCLARKVDWGFPNAILEMASQRGKAAEAALRTFSRFSSRQTLGTVDGNLEAALAKLGDRAAFSEITAELREKQSSFGSAVEKLEYIGNREAMEALLAVLGVPTTGLTKAKSALSAPTADRSERFLVEDRYRVELQIDREFQISILQALARMVENPPLGASAPPTPENFQKWRDWWAKNRDAAELVRIPPGRYE